MPDLERVQQSTPFTLQQQWYEDGAVVDPGTVTVGITKADGTVLVAAGTATSGSGTAARTFNLTTTHTALLDTLKVTWTSTLKGTLVSYVEVVGGFLFTVAEARALKPLDSATNYPTASLIDMRVRVEQALEDACGVAFVPRYERETVSGDGTTTVMLKWPKIRAIRSAQVTVSGSTTALGSADLALLSFDTNGILTGYTWTAGTGNVVVGYEHGWDRPPERIRRAALLLARAWLVSSPVDDRASTFSSADGGTYGLVVEGRGSSVFGIPAVDAAVQQYSLQVGVA